MKASVFLVRSAELIQNVAGDRPALWEPQEAELSIVQVKDIQRGLLDLITEARESSNCPHPVEHRQNGLCWQCGNNVKIQS
jgi:hypothetical protein